MGMIMLGKIGTRVVFNLWSYMVFVEGNIGDEIKDRS